MRFALLFLSLLPWIVGAQESISIDNFDRLELGDAWATTPTYGLSIDNNQLRIDYNRQPGADAWHTFGFSPATAIELGVYTLRLQAKSDKSLQLSVKPSYTDGSHDWLQTQIQASDSYTEISFAVTLSETKTLQTIYFYLDGGSTTPNSATVWLDNLVAENRAPVSFLAQLLLAGQTLHDTAQEGSAPGQFAPGSKATVAEALQAARLVAENPEATKTDKNAAEAALAQALKTFELKENTETALRALALANPNASRSTRMLYLNLREMASQQLLFGQQDALGYGVGWTSDNARSDVNDVCGDFPALAAWSVAGIANGEDFTQEMQRMRNYFDNNGINSWDWHLANPYGGTFYMAENDNKNKNGITAILPGGEKHEWYKKQLDNMAAFCDRARGANGRLIPILFRPFHEANGGWFWWGTNTGDNYAGYPTNTQYISLYQFTVKYLTIEKAVANLLFVYSPDVFAGKNKGTKGGYNDRYPGDNFVDVLGFDDYWDLRPGHSPEDFEAFLGQLRWLTDQALAKGKIAALTETGQEKIPQTDWFTYVLRGILADAKASRIAYLAVWRNANSGHHYAPYPGHPAVDDFIEFYKHQKTIFRADMPAVYTQPIEAKLLPTHPIGQAALLPYPNPTTDHLALPEGNYTHVRIFDQAGRLVRQLALVRGQQTVSLMGLQGYYLVQLLGTDQTCTHRVLVQPR